MEHKGLADGLSLDRHSAQPFVFSDMRFNKALQVICHYYYNNEDIVIEQGCSPAVIVSFHPHTCISDLLVSFKLNIVSVTPGGFPSAQV